MVAGERTVTDRGRPRQTRRAQYRRLAARRAVPAARRSTGGDVRHAPPAGLQRRRSESAAELDAAEPRSSGFDEVVAGLDARRRRATRRSAACPAATASNATTAYAACPEDGDRQARPGPAAIAYDYATCTGCAVCFEQCPCHAIEMVAERRIRIGATADGPTETATMDGNTAVAHVAYRVNEVCAIYPITPVLDHGGTGRRMGGRGASRTSGATSPSCRRCRARAAPPARCTARCSPAR